MEWQVIQSYGFRNIVEDGKVTGFQFKVRNPYYRGIYLSQILTGYATVDGEDISRDNIQWQFLGDTFTWQEMLEDRRTHWDKTKCATILVKKPGGLKQGWHDLRYSFSCTKSYMPPMMNNANAAMQPDPDPERSKTSSFKNEFGTTHHYRRLLIVQLSKQIHYGLKYNSSCSIRPLKDG